MHVGQTFVCSSATLDSPASEVLVPCSHALVRTHSKGPVANYSCPQGNLEPSQQEERRRGGKKHQVEPRWSLVTPLSLRVDTAALLA